MVGIGSGLCKVNKKTFPVANELEGNTSVVHESEAI